MQKIPGQSFGAIHKIQARSSYVGPDNQAVRWVYTTDSFICSSVAVDADGTIYFGSDDGNLYALNSGGRLKWSYKTQGSIYSSPLIDSDSNIR